MCWCHHRYSQRCLAYYDARYNSCYRTYDDGNGNVTTQNQNVVITDVTAPVEDVATLSDVTGQCSITALSAVTATDNCAGTIAGTHNAILPITTQGTTIVTWTYDDGNGNTTTQTQNIVITDVTPPVADVATLTDVTDQCSVTVLTAATATDNCTGAITGTHNAALPIITQGTTIVTWTYDDGNGNTSTQTQNVVITDVTAPVADLGTLADITDQCSVATLTAATATDNCAGAITGTHNAVLPITAQGTTIVTWTYDDGNGNTSTQTQNVIITDITAPVADLGTLPDVTGQCSVTTLTAPSATDDCVGTITGTHNAVLPITTQGTTIVTWTYDDGNGNTSTQTQNVVVSDITAPVADLGALSDVTDACSVTSLTAPTATDNCTGSVTGTNAVTLPITTTTVVTWTYDDGNGNTSTQTQNVIITDVTAPVADLGALSDVTAACSVASLTTPTATDACSGSINGTNTETFPITATTVVTWTYTDGAGNTATQTQNVIISDATAPVIDNASLSDVVASCSVVTLTSPTATDNCDGTVTGTQSTTLPITTQGTTVITWTYTDGAGNSTTQTQNVVITDITAPVEDIATLVNITATCSVASLTAPTAIDDCDGTIVGTNGVTLPITTQGTTVVTWTYTDAVGNTTTQDQNVIINDVLAPVLDNVTLTDITASCSVASLVAPTATDDCVGSITGTQPASLPITGTTLITWSFVDGAGNTTIQTQNVIINDVTAPVADLGSLADLTDACAIISLTAPLATDDCLGAVSGTHTETLPINGSTVITWTYTDGNGNTTTQTQNVIISDATAPVPDNASLVDEIASCSVTTLTPPAATDACNGAILGTHTETLPITTTTIVTWTYTDGNGNSSTQTQNVIINDATAPIANVASLSDVTGECTIASLIAPTATDNCVGNVNGTHNASLPITTLGTTIITWTYTDASGNSTTQSQNVIIADVTVPIADIANLTDENATCEVTTLTVPTATDNCMGSIAGTNNATFPINSQGTTVVVWTYDDGNGNLTTQNQNVIITGGIDATTSVTGATITANNTSATSYQWIDCNAGNTPITNETNQSFTATANGDYAVIVTENGCVDTSACENINVVGTDKSVLFMGYEIYPNPNNGRFNVILSNFNNKTHSLVIKNMIGQVVYRKQLVNQNSFVDLKNIDRGIYFVNITNKETELPVRRIVLGK